MKHRSKRQLNAHLNVIPYIDVMLVLLVIFMITAPLLTQSVDLKLPQAAAQKKSQPPLHPTTIYINAQGQYYLAQPDEPTSKPIPLPALIARISHLPTSKAQPIPILIKADRQTHYEAVVQIIAALKQQGIQHIGLVTQPQLKKEDH